MAPQQLSGKSKKEKAARPQASATPTPPSNRTNLPAIKAVAGFVRENVVKVIGASLGILIPCFWHAHLEAGDLASHTYNAWLAQLISRGQAPGLYVVNQWSNILFDYLLQGLTHSLGFAWGEKIAVSLCVLVFFWGGFALVSAMAGRAAWAIAPLIAMLSYGWLFNVGFFNLYLASGLSLWALALVWCGVGWELALLIPLVLLISRAHLLGLVWVMAGGAYLALARVLPKRWHPLLMGASLVVYFGIREGLLSMFEEYPRSPNALPWMAGGDQLVIYGPISFLVAIPLMIFATVLVIVALVKDGRTLWPKIAAPTSLYVVLAVTVFFVPGGLVVPQFAGAMNFLPDRMTLYAAIIGCCVLGALPLRKWQIGTFAFLALAFFSLLYADTLKINAIEAKVHSMIATLPAQERVLQLLNPVNCRIGLTMGHIVDRECIGRCFSYSNYEPGSLQFRIRATPGNRFVTADEHDSSAMQVGSYQMSPAELPAEQIYFCGSKVTDLCMQSLSSRQANGDFVPPSPRWR